MIKGNTIGITKEIVSGNFDQDLGLTSFGEIWYDDNFNSANYTINAGTFTFTGGNIVLSSGSANFTHFLSITPTTTTFNEEIHCFERWIQTLEMTTSATFGAATFGAGQGVPSINTQDDDNNEIRWCMDTNSSFRKRPVLYDTSDLTRQIKPSPDTEYAALAANTKYWFETERYADIYYNRIYSDAAKTNQLVSWSNQPTSGYANTQWLWHNTGRWGIWNFGGDITIHSWKVEIPSGEYVAKNGKFLWLVDSNGLGFKAGLTSRFINKVIAGGSFGAEYHNVQAGIGDRITEVSQKLSLIDQINCKYIMLMIGTNDKRQGDSDATINTNWTALADNLRALGKTLICVAPPALDAASMAGVRDNIQSYANTYGLSFIDLYEITRGAGTQINAAYDQGDGIHYNDDGHTVMANEILTLGIF